MTLIYPNIVPENNLRLPDALTVKYGPAPLLSRFVLEGDKAAREKGVRLRLRHRVVRPHLLEELVAARAAAVHAVAHGVLLRVVLVVVLGGIERVELRDLRDDGLAEAAALGERLLLRLGEPALLHLFPIKPLGVAR